MVGPRVPDHPDWARSGVVARDQGNAGFATFKAAKRRMLDACAVDLMDAERRLMIDDLPCYAGLLVAKPPPRRAVIDRQGWSLQSNTILSRLFRILTCPVPRF